MIQSSETVPSNLLQSFFQRAAEALNQTSYQSPPATSFAQHRRRLLEIQQECLEQIVADFDTISVKQVQERLHNMNDNPNGLEKPLQDMTQAARQAFARLILQQELKDPKCFSEQRSGNRTRTLQRSDLIEFCGLCQAIVQSHDLQNYLVKGDHLFHCGNPAPHAKFPQERLEAVQRLYFQALGYDPDFATKDLARIFGTADNEFQNDDQVHELFGETVSRLRVVLTHATLQIQQTQLTDVADGGVTRVVSVSYSESESAVPTQESMHPESHLQAARQAAVLEQTLLAQLLQLDPDDREQLLQQAHRAQEDLLQHLSQLPHGSERVEYMTQLSPEKQRLLLMHKLWQGLLARNNGEPPKMQYQPSE
jgi:hypothetical protein